MPAENTSSLQLMQCDEELVCRLLFQRSAPWKYRGIARADDLSESAILTSDDRRTARNLAVRRALAALEENPPPIEMGVSRELSTKVFQGACRLIQLGFKQGGSAGFGLRRRLIDQAGQPKAILAHGEQKSLQTDRVVLALGPEEEVETVRWVYHRFLDEQLTEREIAERLNARTIKTDLGRAWTRGTVHQLLTNEKYVGNSCNSKSRRGAGYRTHAS